MDINTIILIGFTELVIAFLLGIYLLSLMVGQLRPHTELQPIKWLLISSVAFLMLSSAPVAVTYANSLWFHRNNLTIIELTILANATAVLVTKLMLIAIYKFQNNR
jgi:hypothetical protein